MPSCRTSWHPSNLTIPTCKPPLQIQMVHRVGRGIPGINRTNHRNCWDLWCTISYMSLPQLVKKRDRVFPTTKALQSSAFWSPRLLPRLMEDYTGQLTIPLFSWRALRSHWGRSPSHSLGPRTRALFRLRLWQRCCYNRPQAPCENLWQLHFGWDNQLMTILP